MIKALLVLILVLGVLFAWKAWRRLPSLAIFAAALATGAGMLMLKSPVLAAVALIIAAALMFYLSQPRKR